MWELRAGPRLRRLWSLSLILAVSQIGGCWFYDERQKSGAGRKKKFNDPLFVFTVCIGLLASAVTKMILTDTRKLFSLAVLLSATRKK